TGVAALARAEAAADALAVLPRLGGLQVREVQVPGHYFASSTFTRGRTFLSIPASDGLSSCSTERPIRPSPSARSVPRWRWLCPIWLRVCVILTLLIDSSARSQTRRSPALRRAGPLRRGLPSLR